MSDTKVKNPEEQMIDLIGQNRFLPLGVSTGVSRELEAYGRFDFGLIQRVRDNVCPEADRVPDDDPRYCAAFKASRSLLHALLEAS